jgi:sulfide dehydrogenase cytochrome subunit
MIFNFFKNKYSYALPILGICLYSCQKELQLEEPTTEAIPQPTAVVLTSQSRAYADLGRVLAANCFQCHGTNGYGLEHLAGRSIADITDEMKDLKKKNPRAAIMNVHAAAYTTNEINLIADFFSKQ